MKKIGNESRIPHLNAVNGTHVEHWECWNSNTWWPDVSREKEHAVSDRANQQWLWINTNSEVRKPLMFLRLKSWNMSVCIPTLNWLWILLFFSWHLPVSLSLFCSVFLQTSATISSFLSVWKTVFSISIDAQQNPLKSTEQLYDLINNLTVPSQFPQVHSDTFKMSVLTDQQSKILTNTFYYLSLWKVQEN